ncbi:Fic family protein [Ruania rhizosphaerae]|uniref:Fic family protein n=1 Tax=Ruania rhizosphaerae TaxID=1840413 RepID=UPI00135B331E|nr:Fic/DOC family N-terminal domain-containing protein [Ruania rhizosphaerae]
MTNWQADRPYNALPPPPGAEALETRRVLKATIGARTALAQLDQAGRSMPNPAVLINTIPLLEAQASSEIENIVTTTDELFRQVNATDVTGDAATRETLRYRTALRVGSEHVQDRGLTVGAAEQICTVIQGHDVGIRSMPGTRIANPATREIIYSPPEGRETLRNKLAEWETFIHADDGMDPLVRMAAAHYQFEAIHPFTDGNGRTGRILNVLMLVESGLLHQPLLYLSRYLIGTKQDYYRLLLNVTTEGRWEEWITYILTGIERTSLATTRQIAAIQELQASFAAQARNASRGGTDAELLAVLFEQPYSRIAIVMDRCGVSRPTATRWLTELAEAGLIHDVRVGRERLFVNTQFLRLLTHGPWE